MDSIGQNFAVPASSRRAAAVRSPRGDGLRHLAIGLDTVALLVRLGLFLVMLMFAATIARGLLPTSVLRWFVFAYLAPPASALVALIGEPRWWWTTSALALNALDALLGLFILIVVPLVAGWGVVTGKMPLYGLVFYAVYLLFASVGPLVTVISLWRRL